MTHVSVVRASHTASLQRTMLGTFPDPDLDTGGVDRYCCLFQPAPTFHHYRASSCDQVVNNLVRKDEERAQAPATTNHLRLSPFLSSIWAIARLK